MNLLSTKIAAQSLAVVNARLPREFPLSLRAWIRLREYLFITLLASPKAIVSKFSVESAFSWPNFSERNGNIDCEANFYALGLPKFGFKFFPRLKQKRGFRESGRKSMAWSTENCHLGVENKSGVVHPATDDYAQEAIDALKAGKVIAVPTDTLYGFSCDACSLEAVNRIYEIKGRKHTSPLAICVGDVQDIKRFAVTDHLPIGLLDSLLPGPVTIVLSRGESSVLEKSLNPGLGSIGVRVPDCNFIRVISRDSGTALALTSANLSGQPSSVSVEDFENLWEHCAFVYDGGRLPSGRAGSTVIDLTIPAKYKVLRSGSAREETIAILESYCFEMLHNKK